MKPRIILLFLFALTVFAACQKMVDWRIDPVTKEVIGDTSLNHREPSGMLTRVVAVTGSETTTTAFTYDSLKFLISERLSGTLNGAWMEIKKTYTRDTLNRIVRVKILKNSAGVIDSVLYTVYYDEAKRDFLYSACTKKEQGQLIRDSSLYIYDGNGHIGMIKTFQKPLYSYNDPELKMRSEYTYANNNLAGYKNYRDSSRTMVLTESMQFFYDNRVNPLMLFNEAILTGRLEAASVNNATKIEYTDGKAAITNTIASTTFFYGGSGKPLSGTVKGPNGVATHLSFFYQ